MASPYKMQGIAAGLERASQTLLSASLKKRQLKQEGEAFDTDMKIKNLQLGKLEREMDPAVYNREQAILKERSSLNKKALNFASMQLDKVISETSQAKTSLESEAGNEINYNKGRADATGGLDLGGDFAFDIEATLAGKGSPVRKLKKEEIMTKMIQSGASMEDVIDEYPLETEKIKAAYGVVEPDLQDSFRAQQLISRLDDIESGKGIFKFKRELTPEEESLRNTAKDILSKGRGSVPKKLGKAEEKPKKIEITDDVKKQYNELRDQGLSAEEAKKKLGL